MKAFETHRQAKKEADKQNGAFRDGVRVFHKRGDKRKKSWFVGTHIEWLNK